LFGSPPFDCCAALRIFSVAAFVQSDCTWGSPMHPLLRPGLNLVLLGLFALTAANADGQVPPRFATTEISTQQWNDYFDEVRAIPNIQCKAAPLNQYICNSAEQHTIWVFTREGHNAHPAVSRGVVVMQQTDQGATVGIDRSGHYAGNAAAYDVWMKQFARLDKVQIAQWQSALQHK